MRNDESKDGHTDNVRENSNTVESNNAYKKDDKSMSGNLVVVT